MKTLQEATRKYVKRSVIAFIEGGKYARDKKPLSIKWLNGIIVASGIDKAELVGIINELENYFQDESERIRLEEAKQKVKELIEKS